MMKTPTLYCLVSRQGEASPLYESLGRLLVDAKRLNIGTLVTPASVYELPYFIDESGEVAGFVMSNTRKGVFL